MVAYQVFLSSHTQQIRRVVSFLIMFCSIFLSLFVASRVSVSLTFLLFRSYFIILLGAHKLSEEWPQHLAVLKENGEVDEETLLKHNRLYIVGLPGSIDNDMV